MYSRWSYLLVLVALSCAGHVHAQFAGGSGDGHARVVLSSTVACGSFFGDDADGAARALLSNPDPCDCFDGSQRDGAAMATLVNPDSCGQFEGGRADGGGRFTLLSTVPCTAFFSSQRDGASRGFAACLPLSVSASELYGHTRGPDGYLYWYTYAEVNNLGFILSRSDDQLSWSELAFLPGVASSNARRKYETWDREMHIGVNYYRWEQIDVAGTRTLSNIVALVQEQGQQVSLTVYPNPVGQGQALNVHLQGLEGKPFAVDVIDAFGRLVWERAEPASASPSLFQVDLSGFSTGVYFLVLQSEGQRLSRRFVVQ